MTATALVATLDDAGRFRDADQAMSYLGLVPSECSSGGRQHRGHITKAGSPRVRWALVEAAWRVIRIRDADMLSSTARLGAHRANADFAHAMRRAAAAAVIQRVAHAVDGPRSVQHRWREQGLHDPLPEAALCTPGRSGRSAQVREIGR